jgi:hypothetical protein
MKIAVWPAGLKDDATSFYRLEEPTRCLAGLGVDVEYRAPAPQVLWEGGKGEWENGNPPPGAKLMGLAERPDADVVVLQRPGRRWIADLIPHLKASGIRVVVDVDDLFEAIIPQHASHAEFDPRLDPVHNSHWIAVACERADVVTCTTKLLVQRYGFGHGVVLPNLVPERYLSVERRMLPQTIGWSGSVSTHPTDLQATDGQVQRVLDKHRGWAFQVLGPGDGVQQVLGLKQRPGATRWVPIVAYPHFLAQFEIGIVPLADIPFNHGKSWLKMSELAALGVPVVASATPDNERLHGLGVGLIASTPKQWFRRLNSLIEHPDLRLEVAEKGRDAMRRLTYENHCERWLLAWTGSKSLMKSAA